MALWRHHQPVWLLIAIALAWSPLPLPARGQGGSCAAPRLVDNGGYLARTGAAAVAHRADEPFIPASIVKILTALMAIETFGPDHRLATEFVLEHRRQGTVLYVRGLGDPRLVSEEVAAIGAALRQRYGGRITALVLDDSAFALEAATPGGSGSANPYDAPSAALAVNFNSVPLLVEIDGTGRSGESQTPTLPIMRELARRLPPGIHRVNVAAESFALEDGPLRYGAELFIAQLRSAGLDIGGQWRQGRTPSHLPPFYIHRNSRRLAEIIADCLHYSNNFTANQLFLVSGAHRYGFPATWDKGRALAAALLARHHHSLDGAALRIDDGAGLSRKNLLSPAAMLDILAAFAPYRHLLPKVGADHRKSGTMHGVYCYAGFIDHSPRPIPFAIMLNQRRNTRDALLEHLKGCLGRTASTAQAARLPVNREFSPATGGK